MQCHLAYKLFLVIALTILVFTISNPASAATGQFQGKVWVVSVAEASTLTFPAPSATPDITFSTNTIAYLGGWPQGSTAAAHCFTISRFLGGCAQQAFGVKYSHLPNPNLGGAAVDATTPMGGDTFAVIMEFTWSASNTGTHTQEIAIYHDDGVALEMDGKTVAGFNNGVLWPIMQMVKVATKPGTHTYDLLYANVGGSGDGASLMYYSVFLN
jgi:hypothetical protein